MQLGRITSKRHGTRGESEIRLKRTGSPENVGGEDPAEWFAGPTIGQCANESEIRIDWASREARLGRGIRKPIREETEGKTDLWNERYV